MRLEDLMVVDQSGYIALVASSFNQMSIVKTLTIKPGDEETVTLTLCPQQEGSFF